MGVNKFSFRKKESRNLGISLRYLGTSHFVRIVLLLLPENDKRNSTYETDNLDKLCYNVLIPCRNHYRRKQLPAARKKLELTQEWDKVFPKSEQVEHRKVTFHNRYGITLAADLYIPKGVNGKLPAIAVSGPFGAVKEQASGLYAQTLAERGFLTIAFDPSFTGESGGQPRNVASPDINTEDFSAAVDYPSPPVTT